MFRISTVLCLALFLAGAFGLYRVKYQVHDLQVEVSALEAQLAEELEALHVARAEWAYLNRPERVRQLAEAYLDEAPLRGAQLADLSGIPYTGTGENYAVASQDAGASYLIPANSSR